MEKSAAVAAAAATATATATAQAKAATSVAASASVHLIAKFAGPIQAARRFVWSPMCPSVKSLLSLRPSVVVVR